MGVNADRKLGEALYEIGITQYDMITNQSSNIDSIQNELELQSVVITNQSSTIINIESELTAQNDILTSLQSSIDDILGSLEELFGWFDDDEDDDD